MLTSRKVSTVCIGAAVLLGCAVSVGAGGPVTLERVTTVAPFPRGLAMVDDQLYVLCRGRVRGAGGVSAEVEDQAGTLYVVDPRVAEPATGDEVGEAVRSNGKVFALPTDPPFNLWRREANPPQSDRETDRPYCTLRYHSATRNFYLCAFSGIDKGRAKDDPIRFSKNLTDAVLRYDLRTKQWHEVERHNIEAGGNYPHHDPAVYPPPHGWLNGPDNCLPLGRWLYTVSKDNSRLVQYDLSAIEKDAQAPAPPSRVILGDTVALRGGGTTALYGHSGLAFHGGYLYGSTRTNSLIVRIALDKEMQPIEPVVADLVARFDAYDPNTFRSADITDMDFDEKGRLYVVSAEPARIYRFTPDPVRVFDARKDGQQPWAHLADMTTNPKMKSENVMVHGAWAYVTSGDGYGYQKGAAGTVYRLGIAD